MNRTITATPRLVTLGLVVLVGAACGLALTPAPAVVRALVVVPVLVGVAGSAATRLVLGPRTGEDDEAGTDGLLRATMPIVLGIVALLAAVLLAAAVGVPIATPGIAGAAGVLALVLVGAARWRTLARRPADAPGAARWRTGVSRTGRWQVLVRPQTDTRADAGFRPVALPSLRILRAAAGVLGAALVLSAAVACAIALRPVPVEQYTQIALDGAQAVSGSPLTARPDAAVTVGFTLSGYGSPLPTAEPQVDVTVGDTPARSPLVTTNPPVPAAAGTGAVDVQSGSVTFLAPANEGLYTVRITVGPSPSVLVVPLKVSS